MKKLTHTICIVIILSLLVSLAACTEKPTETTGTAGTTTASTGSTTKPTESKSDISFPYTGDSITYSLYTPDWSNETRTYDGKVDQVLREKIGNITLDITRVPSADFDTKKNVMLSTGDMHDIIMTGAIQDIVSRFGPSGFLLNFSDYFDNYMPTYRMKADIYPGTVAKYDGKIYALEQMFEEYNFTFLPTWNYYYTEVYDIQPSKSAEELLDALRKVKEINPDSYPFMSWSGSWLNQLNHIFLGLDPWAVNYTTGGSIKFDWDDTNQWIYSMDRYGVKEMIEYMHTMYEEKLIPPDFLTMPSDAIDEILYGSGVDWLIYTCWPVPTNFISMYETVQAKYPEYYCGYMNTPVWENGRNQVYLWANVVEGRGAGGFVCNADAERPELLCSLIDYLISEEIDTLVHWGFEGETFEYVNGKPQYLAEVKTADNPVGSIDLAADFGLYPHINYKQLSQLTSIFSSLTCMITTDLSGKFKETQFEFTEYGQKNSDDAAVIQYPSPVLTQDEAEEVKSIMGPVNTFVAEEITKFILGDRDLSEWDNFMAEWKAMGDVNRVLEIYNSKELPVLKNN